MSLDLLAGIVALALPAVGVLVIGRAMLRRGLARRIPEDPANPPVTTSERR